MAPVDDAVANAALADAGNERREPGSPGERLRNARERHGLSVEQVAESLHLDESIIVALEQDRFESLGAPVYVRGHLKTYALLLGLPADELIDGIQSTSSGPLVAEALKRSGYMPATINPVLLVSACAALFIGLLLAIYVLLGSDEPSAPDPSPGEIERSVGDEPVGSLGFAGTVRIAR